MTSSYTKFQINIPKDNKEKSGKLKCDGQTDSGEINSPPGKPVGDLSKYIQFIKL